MTAFRQAPETCSQCPQLAHGSCFRCARPLCKGHQHKKKDRCDRCENEYRTGLKEIGASFPPVHTRSRKNLPVTLVMVLLCLVALPVFVAVDLVILALGLIFLNDFWPFRTVRAGVPWLVDKEERLWVRHRRQLRRAFLAEETKLLKGAASDPQDHPGGHQ